MSQPNPYRAGGTFAGTSYTERQADQDLLKAIMQNMRIPFVLAPRQSGKSSLVNHIRTRLSSMEFCTSFVDFSIFKPEETIDWDAFQARFFAECRRSLGLAESLPVCERFLDAIEHLLSLFPDVRLVIFLDEVDALLSCPFKDTFFSILRNIFNERASRQELQRVQFVLAGAARPEELITDRLRSPFNVGEAIVLHELSLEETMQTCGPLAFQCNVPIKNLAEAVFAQASGSVYLTQLILERLWERITVEKARRISPAVLEEEVQKISRNIVAEAPHDIHFENINASLHNHKEALRVYRHQLKGGMTSASERELLWFTGLSPREGSALYLNRIYEQVFHASGPLDQVTRWRRQQRFSWAGGISAALAILLMLYTGWNTRQVQAASKPFSQFGAIVIPESYGLLEESRHSILIRKYPNSEAADSVAQHLISLYSIYESRLHLQGLDLSGMQITELPGVDKLTSLQRLNLSNTQINEVQGLNKLTKLQYLYLNGTKIRKLPGLDRLTSLLDLYLKRTQIEELPGLDKLTMLQSLNLDSTQIKVLPGLDKLTMLSSLSLSNTQIKELPGLEKLTRLKWLYLSGTQIKELPGLEKLTTLKTLNLSGTQIKELPGLEKLTWLQTLNLSGTQIKELPIIEKLDSLQQLYISHTQIKELPGLEKLIRLKTLDLDSTQISELPGLEKLTMLSSLSLSNTQIKELPGLEKLTRLKWLYLNGTQIIELSGLENCTSLREVYLLGNVFSIEEEAGLRVRYPKVKFYFSEQELPK
jgi:Leucine-rich repeat (LRR) protein